MNQKPIPPDPDKMNDKRAQAAERALLAFAEDIGEIHQRGKLGELAAQNLSDLLADMAHFCDREGISLSKCWSNARSNYGEESDGRGKQFHRLKSGSQP